MFYNDDPHSNMPSTERIPSVLMTLCVGRGHVLYTGNWYTSPTLASFFLSKQTHLCGTVRKNRKHFPKDMEILENGASIFRKHADGHPMAVCKYRTLKDKADGKPKVVFMLSTCHDAVTQNIGKVDHNSGVEVVKPIMTIEYNKHMGSGRSAASLI